MEQRNGRLVEKVGKVKMLCVVVKYWCKVMQSGQDELRKKQVRVASIGNLKLGNWAANLREELKLDWDILEEYTERNVKTRDDIQRQMNSAEVREEVVFGLRLGSGKCI